MNYPHWEYFLALDADLEQAARFVALESANFSSYSIEFVHLYLSTCSEIDVVAKALCAQIAPHEKRENIDNYRIVITEKYPKFPTFKAVIPRYGLEFQPWKDWQLDKNPAWWQSYNNVKHERTKYFTEAKLENLLDALAGLFLLLLYSYQPALYDHKLLPWPNLFHLHADNYQPFRVVGNYMLPDFGTSDEWKKQKKLSSQP